MAFAPIALTIPQYEDHPNEFLKAFIQGTVTPLVMATDATGGTTAAKFEIDAQGFPKTAGGARLIPFVDGQYDLWLFPTAAEADANDTTNAIQFADNLNSDPTSDGIEIFATVATLAATSVNSGLTVNTQGYTTAGDGGGATYLIVTSGAFGGAPDEQGDHTLANGNIAVLQIEGAFNIRQFGIVIGDAAANTLAIQAAHDRASTVLDETLAGKIQRVEAAVYSPAGLYVHNTITRNAGVRFFGDGMSISTYKFTGTTGNGFDIKKKTTEELFAVQTENVGFINGAVSGSPRGISGDDGAALAIRSCHLKNVMIYGFDINLFLDESFTFQIDSCLIQNGTTHNAVLKNATAGGASWTRFDVSGDNNVVIEDGSTGTETVVCTFYKCTFQSSNKWGLFGTDVLVARVLDCFFEANNQNATPDFGSVYFADGANTRGKHYEIKGCFFSPGSGTAGQTGIKIDRAEFVETSNMIRGSNISVGMELGVNVELCVDKNSYTNQTTNISFTNTATKILQFNADTIAPAFWGDGITVASFDANDANVMFGQKAGGHVLAGAFDNIGGFQGAGSGSNFRLKLNPKEGDVEICVGTGGKAFIGAHRRSLTSTSSSIPSTSSHNLVKISTAPGNRTYTLQTADLLAGRTITIKKDGADANQLNISTQGAETIDGAANNVQTAAYAKLTVFSDGTNWFTI